MNRSYAIIAVLSAGSITCAQIKGNLPAGGAGGSSSGGVDVLGKGAEAAEAAEKVKKCEALAEMKVAVEEEVAIGGAVAVNWVSRGGGVLIDAPAGANLKDWKSVKLGNTPANELNRYLNRVGKNLAAQS